MTNTVVLPNFAVYSSDLSLTANDKKETILIETQEQETKKTTDNNKDYYEWLKTKRESFKNIYNNGVLNKEAFLEILNKGENIEFFKEFIRDYIKDENIVSIIGKNFNKEEVHEINKKLAGKFLETEEDRNYFAKDLIDIFLFTLHDCILSGDENSLDFLNEVITQADKTTLERLKYVEEHYKKDKDFQLALLKLDDKYTKVFSSLNGKIEDNCQNKIGDCWALASLDAMAQSDNGAKIIADATKETKSGYSITFNGLGETYEVTYEELLEAIDDEIHATGDIDIILWELALEKAFDNHPELQSEHGKDEKSIEGGYFTNFLKAVTGNKTVMSQNCLNKNLFKNNVINVLLTPFEFLANCIDFYKNFDIIFDKIENPNIDCVATISFAPNGKEARYITDVNGVEHMMTSGDCNHALAILKVEGDNVTIVNPHDSSKEIIVSRSELTKNAFLIESFVFK